MKIRTLNATNFLTIGELTLDLADRGLLAITGVNEEDSSAKSNGAGKSSIVDAICWCLWGTTARGKEGDGVVNRKAGKNCRVQLLVEESPTRGYIITRHRRHATEKNALKISLVETDAAGVETKIHELTKGTERLTQEEVARALGCSYEVFVGAIYAGQEQMPDLPGLTDKALKVLVEQAAGITLLEEAYELARKRCIAAEKNRERADFAHANAITTANGCSQRVEDCKTAEKTHADDVKAKVVVMRDNAKSNAAAAREWKDTLKSADKATLVATRDELQAKLDSVAGEQAEERRLVGEVASWRTTGADSIAATERSGRAAVRAAERAHEAAVAKAQSDAAVKLEAARRHKTEIEHLQEELKNLALKVGKPCGECRKTYAPGDLTGAEEALKKRLALRVEEFRLLKGDYDALKAAAATLAGDRSAIERAERDASEELERKRVAARDAVASAERALETHRASMTDVSATSAALAEVNRKIAAYEAIETKVKTLADQAKRCLDEAKALEAAPNPHTLRRPGLEAKLTEALGFVHDAIAEANQAKEALELAEAAVKVFSPAGVRAEILDTVTPFLNDQTAKYLGTLSDGNINATWSTLSRTAKGELREKFSIEVTTATAGDDFKAISGGEKRKARIATALSLQDLVASRASKPIDLFIGDEVDDALDDAGRERLMAVLEEKARERGTVLVISHSPAIRDWIDNCLTIVRKDGQSILIEA